MDKYEDLFVIGQGQYGTAYRARDKHDNQLYCIKRIPMSAKDDHAGALREAQLLDSLDHPNIIRYRESFVDREGALCIVTSFCEEGDLFNRIRKNASQQQYFSEDEVMNMFVQIASAISYIHSKRVLHRDLKTQNIFIARGGIIKLGDFGISKVLERTDSFATTVTGTPYYMAPEICTNQPYTYKSDIWSLGCVLYELCTLKHAFAADSLLSLVYQIVKGTFPPIPTDVFSNGLSDLVTRLLSRDSAIRPPLSEVFKLPYVQRHLDRFKGEEQRRNMKQSTSISRRKQLLETGPGALAYSEGDAILTPKQRMERKKEVDRQRRELELKVASIAANKNREQVAARKKEMIYGSNVGLPGSQPQRAAQAAGGGFEDDDLPNLGTVRLGEDTHGPATRPGGKGIWDVDEPVDPYGATLPSQARQQATASSQRPYTQQGTRGSPAPGALRPGSQRPGTSIAASKGPYGGGGGGGIWGVDDDDEVLQGTVRSGTARAGATRGGLQATAGAHEQPGGASQWTWDRNAMSGLRDDMPNMGTMQMTQGPGGPLNHGSPARPMDYSIANRTGASDSPLMGSMNFAESRTIRTPGGGALGAGTNGRLGGGGGGIAAGADRPASSYGSAAKSLDDRPLPRPQAQQAPAGGRAPASGAHGHGHHHGRGHAGHEDEDGGYSDDFEEDDDEDGGDEVLQQRNRIIQNVEDMASRAYDGRDGVANMQERVLQTGAKNDKARQLHESCLEKLGSKFAAVYDYLSRARRMEPPPDEKEVQRRLFDLVGDKSKMPGCFLVDQLVFTEQMYS